MFSSEVRREWGWALVASALIMLASTLPVVAGALASDPGLVFSGTAYNRQDFNVHLATMRWAENTDWVYSLPFTTETTKGMPVKLAYVALGKLTALLGWPPVFTYHLVRFVLGGCALLLVYELMRRIFVNVWNRRLAFMIASLASGLGWLQLALGALPDPSISPIDFWLSDAYLFFSLMLFPHFALVAICILSAVLGYDHYLRKSDGRGWQATVVSIFLILTVQPFSVMIAYICLAGLVVGHWRASRRFSVDMVAPLVILFMIMLPVVWFNYSAFIQDEIWRSFGSQVIMMSPPPVYYLLGIGLLAPLAIYGGWLAWRDRSDLGLMAVVWLLGVGCLLYFPTQFQRRFSLFITIPVAITAVMGIRKAADRIGPFKPYVRTAQLIFLVLVSISSVYLVAGGMLLVFNRHDEIFDSIGLRDALDWLDSQSLPGDCALSSPRTGLVVPTVTDVRSYAAHPVETAFYESKLSALTDFFEGGMAFTERNFFLAQVDCRWIIVGPYEGVDAAQFQQSVSGLEAAYANETVTIFEWSLEQGDSR